MARRRGRCRRGERRAIEARGAILDAFTPHECRNYFRHAGYAET